MTSDPRSEGQLPLAIEYVASELDQMGPPPAFTSEERYLGYRQADWNKPYAHFFRPQLLPLLPHVKAALHSSPAPTGDVAPLARVALEMSQPGYQSLETGFGQGADGFGCIACLTEMPEVDPCMWQWWFGWHLAESARYKLWHPGAHVFTAPGRPLGKNAMGGEACAYIGNVSYIEEYIGKRLMRLAVRFTPPTVLGFAEATPECVTIVARGGPSLAPVTGVWLIHQVRRTARGSEMRSRFYIGEPQPLVGLLPGAIPLPQGKPHPQKPQAEPAPADLLEHCSTEMNHLASFLPELYREFGACSALAR